MRQWKKIETCEDKGEVFNIQLVLGTKTAAKLESELFFVVRIELESYPMRRPLISGIKFQKFSRIQDFCYIFIIHTYIDSRNKIKLCMLHLNENRIQLNATTIMLLYLPYALNVILLWLN